MLPTGQRVGPYVILSPLGAGGMGEVYRARDPRLERDVALKVIRAESAPRADRRRRFEDEARAAGALNHPNVLSVFDVGLDEGRPYVVFELLEGKTLEQLLHRGPLPAGKAIDYAAQVCQGLAAAHARGIVHRDLKPANLFVTHDGIVKILDFGLAKLTHDADGSAGEGESRTATLPTVLLGTLAYMSPEQACGAAADARSDIFALGATLCEMLSGRPAFRRATQAETLSAILSHDPEAITPSKDPLPAGLEPIVRRCLEKDPEQRFQSARDLGFALNTLAGAAPAAARTPAKSPGSRRWPLVPGLVLAVGVGAAYLSHRPPEPRAALTVVPFTAYPGEEVAPSFSPDGSQIAFAWSLEAASSRFDLYTKVIGSETALRLTTDPADWITPAWSPDGRTIAFARMAPEGAGVYLVSPLGGPVRKLADVPFDYFLATHLSWSPDGKILAYAEGSPESLWTVTLLGTTTRDKRQLGQPPPGCLRSWMPAFSPDGTLLALACLRSISENDLFVRPVSGGAARRVAHVSGDFSGFAWTGDAKSLIFASDGNLWWVGVEGGEPQRLLSGRDAVTPAVSRDGRRLAYAQRVVNANIWRVPLSRAAGDIDRPAPVVSSSRTDWCPAFSPDGRRLAFASWRSGAPEIWVSDVDGSSPRPLTSFKGPLTGSPRWSPGGRWIAFDSRARGQSDIYLVGLEGGAPRRLETGVADSQTPVWSRDGEWLFFSAPVGDNLQLFKVPWEGGTAIQLTTQGGYAPQAASDGRIYYWNSGKSEPIWSVSPAGADERPVLGMPPFPEETNQSWTIGTTGIHILESGTEPGVVFLDFSTGRVLRVADLPGAAEPWGGMDVAPDGRSLVYSRREPIVSDIMLVEDFH